MRVQCIAYLVKYLKPIFMKDREYPVSGFIVPLGNSKKKKGKTKDKIKTF